MFIIWGQKQTRKFLGHVAEFCPICREVRPFRVFRIGVAGHIYYLSLGWGRLAGHSAVCRACGAAQAVDPNLYQDTVKRFDGDLAELERATFPNLRKARALRLELEKNIHAGRLEMPPEVREGLIKEPFAILAGEVEERFNGSSQFDKKSGISGLLTIVIPLSLIFIAGGIGAGGTPWRILMGLAGISFAGGALLTLLFVFTAPFRYLKGSLIPRIAGCLRPLKPTREELEQCVMGLKAMGIRIGKKVKVNRLLEAIERQDLMGPIDRDDPGRVRLDRDLVQEAQER